MFITDPRIIKGIHARQTRDIYQLKMNPTTIPVKTANNPSREEAKPSALTPLIVYASLAIIVESTPDELFLSSNHPMCLDRMLLYSCLRIFIVTFSPMTPKQNF
jgi:hypothetical protein